MEKITIGTTSKTQTMMAFPPPNKTPSEKEAPPLAITCYKLSEEAARVAFESVNGTGNVEGCPPMYTNLIFCKSILHEYAVKEKMKKPEYKTKCNPGYLPRFVSSVDFNGEEYTGEEAASKKEAEQLAAQAAIKSLLVLGSDSRSLAFIIKLKEIKFGWPVLKPILGDDHGQLVPYTVAQVPTPTLIPPSTRQGSRVPYTSAQVPAPALIPPSTWQGRLVPIPSLGPLTADQDRHGPPFKKQRMAPAEKTLLPHSTAPRRSNRTIKPTTRLLEGLESQLNFIDSIDFS